MRPRRWSFGILLLSLSIAPAAAAAADKPNVALKLASQPFGASVGQQVRHEILLTATALPSEAKLQLLFSSTVPMEQLTATTETGSCATDGPIVKCGLVADAIGSGITVTVTGVVSPHATVGTIVHNIATVTTDPADSDVSDNGSANAYVLTAPASPAEAEVQPAAEATAGPESPPGAASRAVAVATPDVPGSGAPAAADSEVNGELTDAVAHQSSTGPGPGLGGLGPATVAMVALVALVAAIAARHRFRNGSPRGRRRRSNPTLQTLSATPWTSPREPIESPPPNRLRSLAALPILRSLPKSWRLRRMNRSADDQLKD